MTRQLRISPRAQKQIAAAASWWKKYRYKAPEAFEQDLAEGYGTIVAAPAVGQPVIARRPGLRRILLERIRYYLYYRVADDGSTVEVIALWHASRRPPRL